MPPPALVTSPRSQKADQARLAGSDTLKQTRWVLGALAARCVVGAWQGAAWGVMGGRNGLRGASNGHGLCRRRLRSGLRTSLLVACS